MAERDSPKAGKDERHYRVYVIELADPRPRRNPELPWVYVGYASKTPWERFLVHKAGGRNASRWVTRYGKRLRRDLYGHVGALPTQEDASRAERKLRQELIARGFSVLGGEPGSFDSHVQ